MQRAKETLFSLTTINHRIIINGTNIKETHTGTCIGTALNGCQKRQRSIKKKKDFFDRRHYYDLKQTPSKDNKSIHNDTCAMRMSHNCDTFVTHSPMDLLCSFFFHLMKMFRGRGVKLW